MGRHAGIANRPGRFVGDADEIGHGIVAGAAFGLAGWQQLAGGFPLANLCRGGAKHRRRSMKDRLEEFRYDYKILIAALFLTQSVWLMNVICSEIRTAQAARLLRGRPSASSKRPASSTTAFGTTSPPGAEQFRSRCDKRGAAVRQ